MPNMEEALVLHIVDTASARRTVPVKLEVRKVKKKEMDTNPVVVALFVKI
jgi:hypothetical protein